ncbi:MAG: hypothetical protein HQL64_16900 [Magnetococcales bacterium]|nr:hypothetical protein [Magnetococcales bacterium]
MSELFVIDPLWEEATDHGPDEIRQTSALLRIAINNQSASRVDNTWSRSVHDGVRLSAYPLALWLASSWWRLRWEPTPQKTPDVDWRLAHDMRSAGYGYLWPLLRIETDGELVTIRCEPSSATSMEPIRYLGHFCQAIPATAFIEGVETFIRTVLARLETVGLRHTDLHALWHEVSTERASAEAAAYRKLEALSGFEPDESAEYLTKLQQLSSEIGEAAAAEIAAACAGSEPDRRLQRLMNNSQVGGVQGNLCAITTLNNDPIRNTPSDASPWDRGRNMARMAREAMALGSQPVSNRRLGEIFALTEQELTGGITPLANTHLSLAVREDEDRVRLLFRRRWETGRRFEAARWLADSLMAPDQDRWLPATESKTARQKFQRAFAAEFLVPIGALQDFLGNDPGDEDRIVEAGNHFNVSPLLIQSHLVNHGLGSPAELDQEQFRS